MKGTIDYYMALPYRMVIVPDVEEGGFTVWYPELPGCITCAESLNEAVANAMDAKETWLKAAIEEGIAIAEPEKDSDIAANSDQFVIQMPKSLKQSLAQEARKKGTSMNQYCVNLLSRSKEVHTVPAVAM